MYFARVNVRYVNKLYKQIKIKIVLTSVYTTCVKAAFNKCYTIVFYKMYLRGNIKMDEDFLSVKDVSNILNLSERKIRKLFSDGVIKSKMIGSKYFTTRKILKAYIEDE